MRSLIYLIAIQALFALALTAPVEVGTGKELSSPRPRHYGDDYSAAADAEAEEEEEIQQEEEIEIEEEEDVAYNNAIADAGSAGRD